MSTITVTAAREDELPLAAAVLAEAFENDPVMATIVPDGRNRRARLTDLFGATIAAGPFRTGTVDLARREDGEVVGAAAWEGPSARRGSTGRLLRELPRLVRALGWPGLAGAAGLAARLERHRPRTPHWYLAEIGVSAGARGLGVGRMLLTTQLRAVDAMRQWAYLESSTPDNRRLYLRHGFEEVTLIEGLPGALPAAMLRRPVAA